MIKAITLFDYLFLLRPTLFYPVWTFFLAGYWGGHRSASGAFYFQYYSTGMFWAMISLTFTMGGVFILNQIVDLECDRANKKLFLLSDGVVSLKQAYWEAAVLLFMGLITGFWNDWRIGIWLSMLILLSGWLYNYPPAQWKDKPIMGLVTNSFGGFIIYNNGWLAGGGEGRIPMSGLVYILAGAAVFLNTTLPDIKGDAKTRKITFGVRYGVEKTASWALILAVGIVTLALWFHDWFLFFPALVVFPFFLREGINRTVDNAVRTTKLSVIALMGAACVVFPLYLFLIFMVFFLSKWYYKKRFHLDYPNLRVS